jgi:hypothetical protein
MKLKILEPSIRKNKPPFNDLLENSSPSHHDFLDLLDFLPFEEALDSGEKAIKDLRISYSIGSPQGAYQLINGQFVWTRPGDENSSLEISIIDAQNSQSLSSLQVTATFTNSSGEEIGSKSLPFIWNPWKTHYGSDWFIPYDGIFHLHVHIENPMTINGYFTPLDVDFDRVYIAAQSFQ